MNKDLVFTNYKNDIDSIFNKLYREKESIFKLYKIDYEDLRQDIYIDILKRIENYDNKKMKITTYLYMIIKNSLCDNLTKLSTQKRKTKLLENYILSDTNDNEYFENYFSINDDNMNFLELKSLLLNKLSEKEINIILLSLKGYSNVEIAKKYACTGQWIGNIKRNAYIKLKPYLSKY